MKLMKRIISAAAAAAIAVGCMPLSALAMRSVTTLTVTEQISKSSTMYVGEITLDGETVMRYIWSENTEVCRSSADQLKAALVGMEDKSFSELVPQLMNSIEAEEENFTAFAFCSDADKQAEMNKDWKSAGAVAAKYYPGKSVTAEVNEPLYDRDEGFAAAVDDLDVKRKQEFEDYTIHPVDYDKRVIAHYDSHTYTDVFYTIEDGETVRHSDITAYYDCDAITVMYTKAELTSKHTVTFLGWNDEVVGCFAVDKENEVYPAYRSMLNDMSALKKLNVYDKDAGKYYTPYDMSSVKEDAQRKNSISKYLNAKDTPLNENLVFYAQFEEVIGEIRATLEAPVCGNEVSMETEDIWSGEMQNGSPKVTVSEGCVSPAAYWVTNKLIDLNSGGYTPFAGTMTGGQKYNTAFVVYGTDKHLSMFPKVWINGVQIPENQVYFTEGIVIIGTDIEAVHDWGEWAVTTPATDTQDGIETRVCKSNNSHTETRPTTVKKLLGDVNGDNKVNLKDLVLLRRYLNKWGVEIIRLNSDMNNDNNINLKDYVLLQRKLNKWDV